MSRRVLQLQIEEEVACLLPADNDLMPMIVDGVHKLRATDAEYVSRHLAAGKPVEIAIKRNLSAVIQIAHREYTQLFFEYDISSRSREKYYEFEELIFPEMCRVALINCISMLKSFTVSLKVFASSL